MGSRQCNLELATKAIAAKQAIAKESSVVLLPDGSSDVAPVVAQAMAIVNAMKSTESTEAIR